MTDRLKPLVAGNWKMNGLKASLNVAGDIAKGYSPDLRRKVDLVLCPPATLLHLASAALAGSGIGSGGQDCSAEAAGAFTGDLSAAMIADAGAGHVIVGHSERRTLHGETSELVKAKAEAAQAAHLVPVICIGETLAEREAGKALTVVTGQLAASWPTAEGEATAIVAYEPVWAIGTGKTPTPADVAEMHAAIRAELVRLAGEARAAATRILYGGSVKPSNAAELMALPNVDGALVGGASLKADDFLGIAGAIA
jgi:triosephosphate isomerase